MICTKTVKHYCCEEISSIENYEEAAKADEMWHCHHRLETDMGMSQRELKEANLYYDRPASELIFLTVAEHNKLHSMFHTEEDNKKKSLPGELNGMFGKTHTKEAREKISMAAKNRAPVSEETKKKISEAIKGRKHSEETKKKMSKNSARWWHFHKRPQYLNEAHSEKVSGDKNGRAKKVRNKMTGESFGCLKDLASKLGVSKYILNKMLADKNFEWEVYD